VENKTIRFVKMNPSGNTTILALDPVPIDRRARIARELMGGLGVGAEQVGFYIRQDGSPRLEMAGGEFCGNATRCFGAWLACGYLPHSPFETPVWREPAQGFSETVVFESSGSREPISVSLLQTDRGLRASAAMPLPTRLSRGVDSVLGAYSIVGFEGITHVILWDKPADEMLLSPAARVAESQGFPVNALGLLFCDLSNRRLIPLIRIEEVGSLVWESSCGSGSAAVACALTVEGKSAARGLELAQPGGVLGVSASYDEESAAGVSGVTLTGTVWVNVLGVYYPTASPNK
jgi:diaminopimelate epimerase